MANPDRPPALTVDQLSNVQGDIWSKGFPKNVETYYFFSINGPEAGSFPECLRNLMEANLIPSLNDVRGDRVRIMSRKAKVKAAKAAGEEGPKPMEPVANALIAFSYKGLAQIQRHLNLLPNKPRLTLTALPASDKAFANGMAKDQLHDPTPEHWDPLFQRPDDIHGVLKVAGGTQDEVEERLEQVLEVLRHGEVITGVAGTSPPTTAASRVDGKVRPDRGKEHFGYDDGVSQPKMDGLDELEPVPRPGDPNNYVRSMNTDPSILIVTPTTRSGPRQRPPWMQDGSFLVFRKLEQDVEGFRRLTQRFADYDCHSPGHMGAKLVGRWPSGAPIELPQFHDQDSENRREWVNNFGFGQPEACPISSHIRKTNIRMAPNPNFMDPLFHLSRIIRSGISYGTDYTGDPSDTSKRGLLFSCYQGYIEDGFQHMQATWCNKPDFTAVGIGHDPIVGQTADGMLSTVITGRHQTRQEPVGFQQLVTMKGGEYFFAPSVGALRGILAGRP